MGSEDSSGTRGYSTMAAAPPPCAGAGIRSVCIVLVLVIALVRFTAAAVQLARRAKEVLRAAGRAAELREVLFADVGVLIVGIHVSRAEIPALPALFRCPDTNSRPMFRLKVGTFCPELGAGLA